MNEYLKNLNRIEFIVTSDCTGFCKHCSDGERLRSGLMLDKAVASDVVLTLADQYHIDSVMTFGGEPLLNPECVYAIHEAAKVKNIPCRQLITNGFFSEDKNTIMAVTRSLAECGVNDILLSVDAFHQEMIPIDIVKFFANEVAENNLPIRLNPAWLVSREDDNFYNNSTAEIVAEFVAMGISEGRGNVVFPEGNALKYLGEYFEGGKEYINPYVENPMDLKSVSVEADGGLLGGNIYSGDIIEILENYNPFAEVGK